MKKNIIGKLVLMVLLIIPCFYYSCSKDKSKGGPELPPENSFIMDFSDFSSASASFTTESNSKSAEILSNYQSAALVVDYWTSMLRLNTAIPVAAFKEAFHHDPSYIADKTWEWKYKLSLDGNRIDSRLEAMFLTDSVQWKMFISVTGDSLSITDFLWFTGVSSRDRTGGSWTINESPAKDSALFSINWSRNSTYLSSIQYIFVKPGQTATGNFIKFQTKDPGSAYDLSYIIHRQLPLTYETHVEWNSKTKAGRYKDINGFHCWDANKLDINCN